MKMLLVLILVALFCSNLFSQDTCNCLQNLNTLIAKTEENYAGFPAKITASTKPLYNALVKKLRSKTDAITNPKTCFYFLAEYVKFFKDKHFVLRYNNAKDYDYEILKYNKSYLENKINTKKLSTVEGIWINADTSLKLAIQRFGNNIYKAIVIESKNATIPTGLVYFTLKQSSRGFVAKEYNSFITTETPVKQRGNLLQIWNNELFGKIYPTSLHQNEKDELRTWLNNNNGLAFKKLSSKTAYLKIPSFLNNDDRIQQLVSRNDSTIKTCENLIVDLTGNGGGNTGWIAFLHYFITNPIVQYDTYLRVTPDNVKSKLADLEPFVANPIPNEYKKYFPDSILAAYKKAYKELPNTKAIFYPIPGVTFPEDSILSKPKKIALIVDDLCGSSTEYFFSIVKQSKKAKTYGINTFGMMDYEGMSNPTAMPYDKFIVTIPIVKSNWTDKAPIDKTGFKPSVLLNKIDETKWVEFVKKDIEQN